MHRFHGNRILAMLLFPLMAVKMLSAAPADPRLLSLVPPGTQLVAGERNQTPAGRPNGFLVMTRNNLMDLRDFISLARVDPSMILRQTIFASGGTDPGTRGEHSILMSGQFDQAHIFKAAVENGATLREFKGFQVLVQHPFERELGTFKDVRWLVVIDSSLALFGTRRSVLQELDRYLDRSAVEPSLMQKLSRLRSDDATWSILDKFDANDELEHVFGSLDPALANLIRERNSFQFGVRYGRKVEVEYEVIVPSGAPAQSIANSSMQSLVEANPNRSLLVPRLGLTPDHAPVHGVVKVTTARYVAWLAECARTAIMSKGN